jgi:hypothetical protein
VTLDFRLLIPGGRRLHVLREDQPLWTRHDGSGESGAQLSSWSFVENLKR